MITIRLRSLFDVGLTLTSGQTFYWGSFRNGDFAFGKPDESGFWWGVSHNRVWALKQEGNKVFLKKGDIDIFYELFGLRDNLEELREKAKRNRDIPLLEALEKFKGLRLMKQDPWETLLCFILSAQNRVENIAKGVWILSKEYGEIEDGIPKFPKPEVLKDADDEFLQTLPLKYKAQALRIKEVARILYENPDFWNKLPDDYYQRRKYLTQLPGVGNKIADCVLAYGLGDGRAVPLDTHMLKVSKNFYGLEYTSLTEKTYNEIGDFYRRRYGNLSALAQLYLYSYSRTPNVLRNKTAL